MTDLVNSPDHYRKGGSMECIDAMKAMVEGIEMGPHMAHLWQTSFKYIWRHPYKGVPVQDLRKSIWYINRLIEEYENED